ncbi:MAG TPA: hypothetical protein VFK14_05105 [Solirubrobacterales bacterium]|nr:hypothetical protein [Solirubrobacterales bacterium]
MEALLEKEGTVENWNDERMDELARRMDGGFNEMREGFSRIEQEIKGLATRKQVQALDDRIFKLMIMMLVFCGGLVTTLLVAVLGAVLS